MIRQVVLDGDKNILKIDDKEYEVVYTPDGNEAEAAGEENQVAPAIATNSDIHVIRYLYVHLKENLSEVSYILKNNPCFISGENLIVKDIKGARNQVVNLGGMLQWSTIIADAYQPLPCNEPFFVNGINICLVE